MCERNISISCLPLVPNWGPGLKPRHIPQPSVELVTLPFAAPRSNPLNHITRAPSFFFKKFIFRGRGRDKEGEKIQLVASHMLTRGPGPRPRHVL